MQKKNLMRGSYRHYLLFILLSTLIFAQNTLYDDPALAEDEMYIPPPRVCYLFQKEDFNHSSKIADDLILDVTSKEYIGFRFSSSRKSFSGYYDKFFECTEQASNHFECSRWDSIEKMHYYMQDNAMYLHIDYLQVSKENDSMIHPIKSKDHNFVKGSPAPCYLSMEPVISVDNVKKQSPKDQLLRSIQVKDVVIYDLDFYKDLVIAVGEDNSPRTRELQLQDEHHESLILRSTNGGKVWKRVGSNESIPHDRVIVVDEKHIIIASSTEGAGGEILTSSDGGIHWKSTYSGGMIETLKQQNNEIILTDITGSVFTSTDNGMSWQETVSMQENTFNETEGIQTEQSTDESHQVSFLSPPDFSVDYETNRLIVQHRKNNCDALSLSLVYNQSNQRKGILGPYWSLGGIESRITLKSKDEILMFNAYKGVHRRYLRGKSDQKSFFYNGGSKIEETADGYLIECDRSTHHFNKNGDMEKIVYKEKTYTLHYNRHKLHRIMIHTKGQERPYLTFDYPYEGVTVTFHDEKEDKNITFIKNNEQLLSNIVEGNQHLYHYAYKSDVQGGYRLWEIEDMSRSYLDRRLLKFEYGYSEDERLSVYDFRQKQNGYIKEKHYYHLAKEKENTSIVNTLTKYLENETLTDVNSDIDIYHFHYFDKEKKNLAFTKHDTQTYGFDEAGRVNFYGDEEGNVSVEYSQFNKIENSLVYRNDQAFNYTYLYTDDSHHYLREVIAPQEKIKLRYDEQGLIKELKTNTYHLQLEYDKNKMTKRIIIPNKGEIITHYDGKNGELVSIKTHSYDTKTKDLSLTNDLTRALQILKEKVSEGSIKHYPEWVW